MSLWIVKFTNLLLWKCIIIVRLLTLRRSLRRKLRIRWLSTFPRWMSRDFLNRTSLTPPQIFDAYLLENTNFSPSKFHSSLSFMSRSCFEWDWREKKMFIYTNQPLITSIYIKKIPIFAELAMSQRWSAIFCATGAWGLIETYLRTTIENIW